MTIGLLLLKKCQSESQSHGKYIENGTLESSGFFMYTEYDLDRFRKIYSLLPLVRPYPLLQLLRTQRDKPTKQEDMAKHITVQTKGSWRFPNTTHLYTNPKTASIKVLLLMLPQFGMIYLMMFIQLQRFACFRKKS